MLALFVCLASTITRAQTCSPFGGVGNVQFLDNTGAPLTSGVLYSFQAGTSTQQATFTDSTCTVQNVNPITFGSGARVAVWLTTSLFYKFVLCSQNDGSACAGGDTLFSVDQVPGGASGSAGGGASPFISASPNPATSGILRLASGDTTCWRNTANSSNICFSKDTSDLLSWAGGSFKLPEVAAPAGVALFDILYADNTAHRLGFVSNGGSSDIIVGRNSTETLANKTLTNPTINTGTLNNTGGTLLNPTVAGGIAHGGTGFQHIRVATCTTAAALNATCSTTFTWPGTWADTNYTVVCSVESGNVYLEGVVSATKTTTQYQIVIINDVGSNVASSATVDCIGVHD